MSVEAWMTKYQLVQPIVNSSVLCNSEFSSSLQIWMKFWTSGLRWEVKCDGRVEAAEGGWSVSVRKKNKTCGFKAKCYNKILVFEAPWYLAMIEITFKRLKIGLNGVILLLKSS